MKNILIIIVAFTSGFLSHAFFFPDLLANGVYNINKVTLSPNAPPQQKTENTTDPLTTKIYFDGEKFSRHNITVEFTRYLQIINTSENQLMWLVSSEPLLTTPRGYAKSEALHMQFNKKGQFIVANKSNPEEKIIITVK